MQDYLLCGWRFRSEVPLADAIRWPEDDHPVDVTARFGSVPPALAAATYATPFTQVDAAGNCRLEIAGVANYLVRDGREVTIEAAPAAAMSDIRVFLLGTVLGMLCHQRGLFPLHASCVRVGARALAFCGPSGIGKSTLAAKLLERGHALLCDDVSVIDIRSSAGPLVWPALPRLRLWQDALGALGVDPGGMERERAQLDKYALPSRAAFCSEATRLGGIFVLRWGSPRSAPRTAPLPAMWAMKALANNVYRHRPALAMGRQTQLFEAAGKIAAQRAINTLDRRRSLDDLDQVAELVERESARWEC